MTTLPLYESTTQTGLLSWEKKGTFREVNGAEWRYPSFEGAFGDKLRERFSKSGKGGEPYHHPADDVPELKRLGFTPEVIAAALLCEVEFAEYLFSEQYAEDVSNGKYGELGSASTIPAGTDRRIWETCSRFKSLLSHIVHQSRLPDADEAAKSYLTMLCDFFHMPLEPIAEYADLTTDKVLAFWRDYESLSVQERYRLGMACAELWQRLYQSVLLSRIDGLATK